MFRFLFTTSLLLAISTAALAALPPRYAAEREWSLLQHAAKQRENAPEKLAVQVLSVEKVILAYTEPSREDILSTMHSNAVIYQMTLTAGVVQVEQSASGLTPGDTVTIRYQIKDIPPMPGPRRFPMPEPGTWDLLWAHLQPGDESGIFAPAAGSWSFTSPKDFEAQCREAKAEYDRYWPEGGE